MSFGFLSALSNSLRVLGVVAKQLLLNGLSHAPVTRGLEKPNRFFHPINTSYRAAANFLNM